MDTTIYTKGISSSELLEYYGVDGFSSDHEKEEHDDHHKKTKITTAQKQRKERVRIQTRFEELSSEVLLNILDFILPFFSNFEKVTSGMTCIDFNDRRKSTHILSQVLHGIFSGGCVKLWIKEYCGVSHLFGNKYGVEYKYLNTSRSIFTEALMMRQLVLDEIVSDFYNFIRVSKRTFYSFLIDDCYDMLVVKLFWEGIYQCIRNPDLVLNNSRVPLTEVKILPASQYILTEPVYTAVLRSRYEPVWLAGLFLFQPSFGFGPYVKWINSKKSYPVKTGPTEIDWKQFLKFLQKQISKYPLLKSDSKYYSSFSVNFDYVKECGFNPDVLNELVYIDSEIPLGSRKALQSIESPTLLKQLLNKNLKKFLGNEVCCKNSELFVSSLRKLKFDILDLIMDFQKNKMSEVGSAFLDFSPIHILVDTCLSTKDFKKNITNVAQMMKKMRKHFMPIADIFLLTSKVHSHSNPLCYLIQKTSEEYGFSRYMTNSLVYMGVFETFYQVYVEELGEDDYEIVTSTPNLIQCAAFTYFAFPKLFSKSLPSHVLKINEKLLLNYNDNVISYILDHCEEKAQVDATVFNIISTCLKKNPPGLAIIQKIRNKASKIAMNFTMRQPEKVAILEKFIKEISTLSN